MQPKIGLVISTLNKGIFNLQALFPAGVDEILIVHQVIDGNEDLYKSIYSSLEVKGIKIIKMTGAGLSKSRNAGLKSTMSDYLLICDDDAAFESNLIKILQDAIHKFPDGDIFTFKTKTPEGLPYKKYPDTIYVHSKRSSAKVSSIEILIKKSFLEKSKLEFDERFGLGSLFPTGEEFIFLSEAIAAGAKVIYIPEYIVTHPALSSGQRYSDDLIRSKGALFARTYGWKYPIVDFIFALKKFDHYKKEVSFLKFLKLIFKGSIEFRRL